MTEASVAELPTPRDDDDDDVAWALQTAQVQWQRGSPADAIVWLRRAVDSAIEVGAHDRASELNRATARLTERLLDHSASSGSTASAEPLGPSSVAPIDSLLHREDEVQIEIGDFDESQDFSEADEADLLIEDDEVRSDEGAEEFGEVEEINGVEEIDGGEEIDEADEVEDFEGVDEAEELSAREELPSDDDELTPERGVSPPQRLEGQSPPSGSEGAEQAQTDLISAASFDEEAPPSLADELEPEGDAGAIDWDEAEDTGQQDALGEEESDEEESDEDFEDVPDSEPAPAPRPTEPVIDGVDLLEVEGLQDLPEESLLDLVAAARLESLGEDEELGQFGMAVVTAGEVSIMAAVADSSCARVSSGCAVFTRGSLAEGISLRVVAAKEGARLAVWPEEVLDNATADCPWVRDDLSAVADRFQTLAGVTMGPLGERLDATLLGLVTERASVRKLLPGDVLLSAGDPVDGLYVIGAGVIELSGDSGESELGPGDFLFAEQVMGGGKSPHTVRALTGGALLLFVDRRVAHELLVGVPPLLEILAGG